LSILKHGLRSNYYIGVTGPPVACTINGACFQSIYDSDGLVLLIPFLVFFSKLVKVKVGLPGFSRK